MARKRITEQALGSWEEVNAALRKIGEAQLEIDLIETDMNASISAVKEEAKDFLEWLVTSERGQYYLTEVFGFVPGLSTMSVSEEQVGPLSAAVSEAIVNGKTLGWEWPKYPNGAADDIGDAIIEYAAGRLDRVQFLERVQDIFVRLSEAR